MSDFYSQAQLQRLKPSKVHTTVRDTFGRVRRLRSRHLVITDTVLSSRPLEYRDVAGREVNQVFMSLVDEFLESPAVFIERFRDASGKIHMRQAQTPGAGFGNGQWHQAHIDRFGLYSTWDHDPRPGHWWIGRQRFELANRARRLPPELFVQVTDLMIRVDGIPDDKAKNRTAELLADEFGQQWLDLDIDSPPFWRIVNTVTLTKSERIQAITTILKAEDNRQNWVYSRQRVEQQQEEIRRQAGHDEYERRNRRII